MKTSTIVLLSCATTLLVLVAVAAFLHGGHFMHDVLPALHGRR
jgi:hypothetical protein